MSELRLPGVPALLAGLRPAGLPPARTLAELEEAELWRLHDRPPGAAGTGGGTLVDVKIALARRLADPCRLCPRVCGARRAGRLRQPPGACGLALAGRVEVEGLFTAEEAFLCPTYEVFLAGCNLECPFCYEAEANAAPRRRPRLALRAVAGRLAAAAAGDARSLHLVGGEPTCSLPAALTLARACRGRLPLVWNTNLYAAPEVWRLLAGVADVVIGDVHFGPGACSRDLAGVPDAWEAAFASLAALAAGPIVVVRHLLLPGHLDCCARPVMERLAAEFPGMPFHLLENYTPPFGRRPPPPLARRPSTAERTAARALAGRLGLGLHPW